MGYSLAELKGKHHSLFCAPEDAASADYKAFWQKLNRGEYVADRFKRVDRHGREVWLEATYNPVHDTEGNLYKVVKFANVVTERSEEHTSELQSLMRSSYAVFCLKKKKTTI